MSSPKTNFSVNYQGKDLSMQAVQVSSSFIIYEDGKVKGAVSKIGENWTQPVLEHLPDDLFNLITTRLEAANNG